MNIRCSGGKYDEPITKQQCLNCALESNGKQPCGYGYRLLYSLLDTQEDRTEEIHVTDLTGCMRKAYYSKVEPEPPFVHDLLVLWMGNVVHDALDIDNDEVSSEVPVATGDVIGRLDAKYTSDGRLEDVKTTRWMSVTKLPYGSHETQINYYNAMQEEKSDSLQIQMIDLSGPTKCRKDNVLYRMIGGRLQCPICGVTNENAHLGAYIVDVPVWDKEYTVRELEYKAAVLKQAIEDGDLPDPEPSYLCGYCPFSQCEQHPEHVRF